MWETPPRSQAKKIWDSIILWQLQKQFLRKERKLLTVLPCPKSGILKQGIPEDLDEFCKFRPLSHACTDF